MTTKPDLTTTEGVLEWAGRQTIWHANPTLDEQTAAYIAECVRLYENAAETILELREEARREGFDSAPKLKPEFTRRLAENERLRQAFEAWNRDLCASTSHEIYDALRAAFEGIEP